MTQSRMMRRRRSVLPERAISRRQRLDWLSSRMVPLVKHGLVMQEWTWAGTMRARLSEKACFRMQPFVGALELGGANG